uniref:T-complex protein beta SU n=1 Tax=Lotharella vacuolata TaxID=74820 RepID=A0A0H5BL55_9EUKA|nr:T-complex protein beta SU [Lotharella vacuolata]
MKNCKIVNKKILNFLIINSLVFIISLIKKTFGPSGLLKMIKKKKSFFYHCVEIYVTKNTILIIKIVCKSNPLIYPIVMVLKENNTNIGDGGKILVLFLSEIISKSLINFLFENKKKITTFRKCILKSIDILNFSRIRVSKHLTEFLFFFIFNCLETTCYSKIAKSIAFEIITFFFKFYQLNKKTVFNKVLQNLSKIKITNLKIGSIFDLLLFCGFIYSEQNQPKFNKKMLKNTGIFICIDKISTNNFYSIYKFFLNSKKKDKSMFDNIVVLSTTNFLFKPKYRCKNVYILGNFKEEFLLKISVDLQIPIISNFMVLSSEIVFTVEKVFEYELFGSLKLFFQKKKDCKYFSVIILSGEKTTKPDLKSVIYKTLKSYLNILDHQFMVYGAGYIEMLISKYLLKTFFSELNINPMVMNVYLESLLSIPKILLKNLGLKIDYFFKLINYLVTGNNVFIINNKKKCFSLVKYAYCFEPHINKEFLYNIIMVVIREFNSLNSLVVFF